MSVRASTVRVGRAAPDPLAGLIGSTEPLRICVAPHGHPRAVEFVDAPPRTETGKPQRHRLHRRG